MHYTLSVLKALDLPLTQDSRIVDFGCGAGGFIQAARAEGYDAVGCDFYRNDGAQTDALIDAGHIKLIEQSPYRLPYDDNSVDFIVSETVLEHVMNPDEAAREMARILKPGGAAFHFFPARYAPIEGHINVPLASFFRPYPYLRFWAAMGIRNVFQKDMNAKQVADTNAGFLKNNTNYLTGKQMRDIYGQHFRRVDFVENTYLDISESAKARLIGKLNRRLPFVGPLYRTCWAVPLLLVK